MSVCQEFGVEGTKKNAVLDAVSWVLHILSTGRDLAAEGEAEACRAARSLTSRVCRWSLVRKLRSYSKISYFFLRVKRQRR